MINTNKLKKESIEILNKKYGKENIIEFSDITIKDGMNARNKNIPDLIASNSIIIQKDNKYTSSIPIFIARGNTYEELFNNYISEINDI